MKDARAISAQLVDIRNVGTHKVVKLTLHAPEEQAMKIMEMFGWPTGVNPVPVAIARLNPLPKPDQSVGVPAGRKSPAQIAGYLCTLPAFHKFLQEGFTTQWRENYAADASNEEIAAGCVRDLCTVASRSEIKPDNAEWNALQIAFKLWEREAEIVPA